MVLAKRVVAVFAARVDLPARALARELRLTRRAVGFLRQAPVSPELLRAVRLRIALHGQVRHQRPAQSDARPPGRPSEHVLARPDQPVSVEHSAG